jgi:hypothetical protein
MQTEIDSRVLVLWIAHKSLAQAKSLFAPYSPKFRTVPCNEMPAFGKATVSVLYLSDPEQDPAVGRSKTSRSLRSIARMASCLLTTRE